MQIDSLDSSKNSIQNVKQRFFALRNGILADRMRQIGAPYRIIFGLNMPQLKEIADVFGHDRDLAETLWANSTTRESRLLAPLLVDPSTFTIEDASRWLESLSSWTEEIDMLCHALLRKTEFAYEFMKQLVVSDDEKKRYAGLRLAFKFLTTNNQAVRIIAAEEKLRNNSFTRAVAQQLYDEAEFIGETI